MVDQNQTAPAAQPEQASAPAPTAAPATQPPAGQAPVNASAPQVQGKKSNTCMILVIVLIILLVVLGGGGYLAYRYFKNKAKDAVEQTITPFNSGTTDTSIPSDFGAEN